MPFFSIIIPVYNRPDEVDELLESLNKQTYKDFEVLLIEDGSSLKCDLVARKYSQGLNIRYYYKDNSGRSETRNYGMEKAKGDYFVFFDGAENAFVSAYRKYKENQLSFNIHIEYIASPLINDKTLIITDPMLATGGSMELSYHALLTKGKPKHIHIATVIASQQAIDYCREKFPAENTTIWAAAIDPYLDEHAYIVPGLGDAGDLAYGAKE